MLTEEKIREKLDTAEKDLEAYNWAYITGYKQALRDVLEIKNPKARPANTDTDEDGKR